MAPPSENIDGEPRWFSQGQSVSDNGLSRTPFGIPSNCVGPSPAACVMGNMPHFTWHVEQPLGTHLAEAFFDAGNVSAISGGYISGAFITCGDYPGHPGLSGMYIYNVPIGGFYRFWSGYSTGSGSTLVLGFSVVPFVPDVATDVFLIWAPGP